MAFRITQPDSVRCIAIALILIALSIVLQWVAALVWADPTRTRAVLETLYVGRGALLQALHVMAFALLTIGLLRSRWFSARIVCAAWAAAACLIEAAQHPVVVNHLLKWSQESRLPQVVLDASIGSLANARFTWMELAAPLVGGAAAAIVARHYTRGGDR